ncbi:IclR family transcriptional regulator [Novosphingobium malaysiense]|uniref:IclR family transcriptional regulator n=1 Tax=Novosphingobium malaysiense TaxID=1348853 RepID=UPI0012E05C74|nr:helix-turn-helix domain-containing protein [Novosphingobium malaysiense]
MIDVLNFLAAHPMESFSLADIARPLGLSNGSAHRILTTLAQAKFLYRNESQRTYSLGIAMVAIGEAAVQQHRGVDVARRELTRLAVELNMQCSASAVVENEILVLVREGVVQTHRGLTRVGERRPLLPPLGLCYIAWSSEAAIEAYIAKAEPYMAQDALERLREALPLIRQRGYAIAASGQAPVRSPANRRDEAYWSSVYETIANLTPNEVQFIDNGEHHPNGIAYIGAPVFSPEGEVVLQLVVSGIPRDLSAPRIRHCADRLRATAAIVTNEIYGHIPGM